MVEGLEKDEFIAMQEAYQASLNSEQKTNQVQVEQVVESKESVVEDEVKGEVVAETKVEAKVEEVKPEIVEEKKETPVKSFEEYLSEKSGGKYKEWSEIESLLNTPKEEFANDEIKRLNELAKNGIKLDEEFFEIQRKDYENTEDASFILKDVMKYRDNMNGLSDKTLEVQLNKKYNYNEWKDKDDDDMTPEDLANEEIMLRDATEAQSWLINFKKERTLPTFDNSGKAEMQKAQELEAQLNWEKYVDEGLFSKVTNLTTPLSVVDGEVKEKFVFEISESDRKDVANTMKLMTKDINVLFNRFLYKDEKGAVQINHQKVYEMLVKEKAYDPAVKNAFQDGLAVGKKNFVKDELKNVNFTPKEGATSSPAPQTEAEAIREAMKKQNLTF